MKKKSQGEWSTTTIKESKGSEHTVWRLQRSISPDGKKFIGVRKYAIKANGDEVVTRDGLSFLADSPEAVGHAVEGLKALAALFDLGASVLSSKPSKPSTTTKGASKITNVKTVAGAEEVETKEPMVRVRFQDGSFYKATQDGVKIWAALKERAKVLPRAKARAMFREGIKTGTVTLLKA